MTGPLITLEPTAAMWTQHKLRAEAKRLRDSAALTLRQAQANVAQQRPARYIADAYIRAARELEQAAEGVRS